MTLAEYMASAAVNQVQASKGVGVTQPCISRVLERGTASVEVALAIEKWSRGQVPAETLNSQVAAIRQAA